MDQAHHHRKSPPEPHCSMPVDFLSVLPPEVAVGVLSSGVLSSIEIRHVAWVSKAWAQLVHFPAMWRALALRWGLAERPLMGGEPGVTHATQIQLAQMRNPPSSPDRPKPRLVAPTPPILEWRMVVCLMDLQSVQWTGRTLNGQPITLDSLQVVRRTYAATSLLREIAAVHDPLNARIQKTNVWRFKALPDLGLLAATVTGIGGLFLIPMDGTRSACHLPPLAVTSHTHLEADGSCVVFDGPNGLLYASEIVASELANTRTQTTDPHDGWCMSHPTLITSNLAPHDQPFAFRMKNGTLACFTAARKAYFYDINRNVSIGVLDLYGLPIQEVHYIDFDSDYLFVTGMLSRGVTDVYAISRHDTAAHRYVWSLVNGPLPFATDTERRATGFPRRPTEVARHFMRLHFPHWRNDDHVDTLPGIPGYYHGVIQPLFTIQGADPLLRGRWGGREVPTEPWDTVHMDDKTGTLVMSNICTIAILRNYKRLFTEPDYQLELEAYIDLTLPMGVPPHEGHERDDDQDGDQDDDELEWEYDPGAGREVGAWEETGVAIPSGPIHSALSVAQGHALCVNHAPILFDFSHYPNRPEDIRVTLLAPIPDRSSPDRVNGEYQSSTCAMVSEGGSHLYTLRMTTEDIPSLADEEDEDESVEAAEYNYQVIEQWDLVHALEPLSHKASSPSTTPWE